MNTCLSYTSSKEYKTWLSNTKKEGLLKDIMTKSKLSSIWKTDIQQVF